MSDNSVYTVIDISLNGDGTSDITVENGGKRRTSAVSSRLLTAHGITLGSELDKDGMYILSELEELTRAIKKGIDLLSYSDMSCRALAQKLKMKGFENDTAVNASAYLQKIGYINEERCAMTVASACIKDMRGPLAIKDKLISKGFERACIEKTMNTVYKQVDFVRVLEKYARKKGILHLLLASDLQEGQKAAASVLRRGFTFEHISALRSDKRERIKNENI